MGILYSGTKAFKNKIINGNFDIWQRNTTQTSSGYGSADRWDNGHGGSTKTFSRQLFTIGQTTVPNNPKFYSRTVVSSVVGVSNATVQVQRIEDVASISGETVTLSFWAKADASKNIATEFYQYFGTGGTPSSPVSAIGVTTHTLTTSWQKFTVTTTIPSVSGKTLGTDGNSSLQLFFWFDAGSGYNSRTNSLGQQSGTFDIAQVQLEEGSVATPFEQRPVGMEIQLCQRYFNKNYNLDILPGSTGSTAGCNSETSTRNIAGYTYGTKYPVEMRTIPTVTIYSPTTGASGYADNTTNGDVVAVAARVGSTCFGRVDLTGATTVSVQYYYTADAEL